MSFSEKIQQMDREVGARVEHAIAELRREISERVRKGTEEMLSRFEEVKSSLPSSLLGHEDVAPLERELRSDARRGAHRELRDSLIALDGARSQAQVLAALLAATAPYASRAAILLTRAGEIRGWGSRGFAEGPEGSGGGIRDLDLGHPLDGAWSRLAEGRGVVPLSAADCAPLCSRLESPLPQEAVLVPLVLRDRVAATLYADRTSDAAGDGHGHLAVEALQTLVYVAAQAIETLPFRERESTPTLRHAEDGAADAGLGLWPDATPDTAPDTTEAAEVDDAAEAPAPSVEEDSEPAAAAEIPAPAPEPEPQPTAIAAPAPEALPEPEPPVIKPKSTPWWAASTQAVDVVEEEKVAEPKPAEPEVLESAADFSLDDLSPELASPEAAPAAETPEAPAAPIEEPAPVAGRETVLLQRPLGLGSEPLPSPFLPHEEAPAAPVPAPAAPDTDDTADDTEVENLDETHPGPLRAVAPLGFAPAPAPAPAPQEAEAAEPARGGTVEVRPPSGVDGPGWAFATTRVPVAPDDASIHEEARRLARLLVSEIKLYNEDQVEEGRRNRDLYERLKEDIDRSRQMYEERVEPRIIKSTDYFYQELVRILAAGDARALGI